MLPDGAIGTAAGSCAHQQAAGHAIKRRKTAPSRRLRLAKVPPIRCFRCGNAPLQFGMGRPGAFLLQFLIAGYPESDPQSHPIHLRSRWLIWIAPVPRIITATFVMCGSVACNATKSGSSSGPRKKNLTPEQEQRVWGDSSTGTAIDADASFCVTHYFSDRSGAAAHEFMQDRAERIVGRPRITRTRIGRRLYLLGRNNFLQRLQAS